MKTEELDAELGKPLEESYRAIMIRFMEEEIPFNKMMGMKCTHLVKGRARIELPARTEFTGDPFRPALHGGVLSTLADTVGGLAVFSMITPNDRCSTIDLRVDYLRPGRVNTPLIGEAEIIRIGNRVGVANVLLFHDDDKAHPVAMAKGVYSIKRGT